MTENVNAKKIVPWIIAIAVFMERLDVTITSTAVPDMALGFMVSPLSLRLALTTYLLSLALFMPISNWIAVKFGVKPIFMCALLVFTLSSVACGKSRCLSELVMARIVQGMSGAFMTPVGQIIILKTFTKSELIYALNLVVVAASVGPFLGPVVGGFITTYYSWPWVFYINVPIGLLGILVVWRYIRNFKETSLPPFDMKGYLLFGFGLVGCFFAIETIAELFKSKGIPIFIGIGGLLLLFAFYRHYRKVANPVLNLGLFSIRTFSIASLGSFFMRAGSGGIMFLLPLFFQIGYGLSPLDSGLLTCVTTLGAIIVQFVPKTIFNLFGFRNILFATSVSTGISICLYSLITKAHIPMAVLLIVITGTMMSLQSMAINGLYYANLDESDTTQGTSIINIIRQLATGFGMTLATIILQSFVGWHRIIPFHDPLPFRFTFLVIGAMVALSVFVFFRLKSTDGQEMTRS